MRLSLFFVILIIVLMGLKPKGFADYGALSEAIEGYRALTNTPQFPVIAFYDEDGREVFLESYRGKTVLLNLWATWCPPCLREMPALNELAREFKGQNFVVLSVATGKQGRESPRAFLDKRGLLDVENIYDPKQKFLRMVNIKSLPVTFLIDPMGRMQGGVIGMTEWNTPHAKAALSNILK